MVVWTPDGDTGGVTSGRVKGTAFAVAELEFSEPMEVLAGLMMDIDIEHTREQDLTTSTSSISLQSTGELICFH
jgi:hypothetical protein